MRGAFVTCIAVLEIAAALGKLKLRGDAAAHSSRRGQVIMDFNLSSWWHRSRVRSEFVRPDRVVQVHRVMNPYHAVSIKAGPDCVQTQVAYGGTRFLSAEAPVLPAATCNRQRCSCHYQHHEDRRGKFDRRSRNVWEHNARMFKTDDRRRSNGRRVTD
jgi:hypothetical protein